MSNDLPNFKSAFEYDPASGLLHWRTTGKGRRLDRVAGTKNHHGYLQVRYCGLLWQVHRIAWLLSHGSLSNGCIDHINRIRDDNRLANLRLVSMRENLLNSARFDQKTENQIGATFHKQARKWQSKIKLGGRDYYLGLFASREEACAAYRKALADHYQGVAQ